MKRNMDARLRTALRRYAADPKDDEAAHKVAGLMLRQTGVVHDPGVRADVVEAEEVHAFAAEMYESHVLKVAKEVIERAEKELEVDVAQLGLEMGWHDETWESITEMVEEEINNDPWLVWPLSAMVLSVSKMTDEAFGDFAPSIEMDEEDSRRFVHRTWVPRRGMVTIVTVDDDTLHDFSSRSAYWVMRSDVTGSVRDIIHEATGR